MSASPSTPSWPGPAGWSSARSAGSRRAARPATAARRCACASRRAAPRSPVEGLRVDHPRRVLRRAAHGPARRRRLRLRLCGVERTADGGPRRDRPVPAGNRLPRLANLAAGRPVRAARRAGARALPGAVAGRLARPGAAARRGRCATRDGTAAAGRAGRRRQVDRARRGAGRRRDRHRRQPVLRRRERCFGLVEPLRTDDRATAGRGRGRTSHGRVDRAARRPVSPSSPRTGWWCSSAGRGPRSRVIEPARGGPHADRRHVRGRRAAPVLGVRGHARAGHRSRAGASAASTRSLARSPTRCRACGSGSATATGLGRELSAARRRSRRRSSTMS